MALSDIQATTEYAKRKKAAEGCGRLSKQRPGKCGRAMNKITDLQ